jgi:hypothetical protein
VVIKEEHMENNRRKTDRDNSKIPSLENAIQLLEKELMKEVALKRAELKYGMEKGRAIFEKEVLRRHKELKIGLWKYIKNVSPGVFFTSPIIYFGIFPIMIMDIFVTVYQFFCFPAYNIPKVKRSDYFVFERTHLQYLNVIQAINCAYCSYGNGVIAYAREIFALTEQHWCPIKHAKKVIGYHDKYQDFAEFGDADAFVKRYMKDREGKKIE